MRWESLFADLEAEFDAAQAAELDLEVRDRTRGEVARLRLVDRLRPAVGQPVRLTLLGAGDCKGTLARVGADWLLLAERPEVEVLVPLAAVLGVVGLGAQSQTPGSEGAVGARLSLAYALRGLARRRQPLAITTVDGGSLAGTLDRVGADFLELAEHPVGEPRRAAEVRSVRTVPFAAVAAVRAG